jgi:hypothetical protein
MLRVRFIKVISFHWCSDLYCMVSKRWLSSPWWQDEFVFSFTQGHDTLIIHKVQIKKITSVNCSVCLSYSYVHSGADTKYKHLFLYKIIKLNKNQLDAHLFQHIADGWRRFASLHYNGARRVTQICVFNKRLVSRAF